MADNADMSILVSDKAKAKQNGKSKTSTFDTLVYKNLGFQMQVRLWYDSTPVQYFFTSMILLNFVIILLSATPWAMDNTEREEDLRSVDQYFVYLFLVELLINMYGNWFWHFWQVSRWNWFDFIVIALSLASPVMSAIRVARVVRLLRVLRVAGKLTSLRTVIATLDRSTGSVGAVVALLLMLMCIFAVFGVHDYRENDVENFGDLGKAMFSMFQLVTGENWPELARPLMYGTKCTVEDGPDCTEIKAQVSAPLFFILFMILAALTTIEVVAAIFLDKMTEAKEYVTAEIQFVLDEEKAREELVRERVAWVGKFNSGEISGEELQEELDKLQAREDTIDDGHLDADEVAEKVDKEKTLHLSMDMAEALKKSVLAPSPPGGSPRDSDDVPDDWNNADRESGSPASEGAPKRGPGSAQYKADMQACELLGNLLEQVEAMSERMRALETDLGLTGRV